jgi:hypothetical protein
MRSLSQGARQSQGLAEQARSLLIAELVRLFPANLTTARRDLRQVGSADLRRALLGLSAGEAQLLMRLARAVLVSVLRGAKAAVPSRICPVLSTSAKNGLASTALMSRVDSGSPQRRFLARLRGRQMRPDSARSTTIIAASEKSVPKNT